MASNETSIIISAVDKTQGALNSVNNNLSSLEGQFSKLTGVVSGFAALAGVTAFAGIVKGAVDSAAGLHDMAQQTGASVESLSAMRGAAKLAGVDMEQVAGGLGKLSKNMLAASQGSGDAANVFKALGISVTDSSGKLKSSDTVFMEFSKSLQTVGSSSERAAAAQLVLGKSGAQLLPMMNDLGVAGELQAKITTKQAAAADDLQDNILRLSTVGQAWKTTVAMEMVPAANAFVEALLEVSTTTDGSKKAAKDLAADGSIKEWAISSAKAVGFVVDSFDGASRVIKAIGMTIGAASAQAAMLAQGNLTGALAIGKEWQSDLGSLASKEQFSDVLARKLATIGTEAPKAAAGTTSLANALGKLANEGGKASNALDNLHITQMALVTKQAAAELDALTKQQDEYVKALQSALGPLETQAQNLEREVANYGLAESTIQGVIVARMEEARALAALNGAWPEHLDYLDREIELRKRIATASSQKDFLDANKKAAEQSAKEWEKFSDDINRALTDALMRGFEDGKSFGQNFVDSLKNSLKTAALKIVVNYVTGTGGSLVAGAANAVLGTTFNTGNGASGSNLLGTANNLSTAYSAYNNAGLAYNWATGSMSTANTAGTIYANTTGTGLDGLLSTNAAYGTAAEGASAGSSAWAGMLEGGWVALIPIIGKALFGSTERYLDTSIKGTLGSDGFTGQFGDTYKTTGNIFGAVGRQTDWYPVTDSSADIAGSTAFTNKSAVQSLMSPTEYGGYSAETQALLDENLSSQLASITDQSAAFKQAFESIYNVSKTSLEGMAKVFEDSTLADKIKDYAVNVDVQFSGSVDKVFADFGEKVMVGMGSAWLPSVEALRASGETWSQALGRLSNEAGAMGQILLAMGSSIKDAFGPNSTDAILRTSDSLVKLFGSVENLGNAFGSYYANFYTQEEQNKKALEALSNSFANIGMVIPKTREEFRGMVDSLDLTTTNGQYAFKALMDLQSGFATLVPVTEKAVTAINSLTPAIDTAAAFRTANQEAQASQITAYLDAQRSVQSAIVDDHISAAQAAADSASNIADAFQQILDSLDKYKTSLLGGSLSTLTPAEKYAEAKRNFETTSAKARLGDKTAAGDLQSVSDAFLQASKESNNFSAYQRDFGNVVGTLDSVIGTADRQKTIAEQSLSVAQAQLASLESIQASLVTTSSASSLPLVVNDYQQAATDWANWFSATTIGDIQKYAVGTVQRISDSMGMLTDSAGQSFTFSANDSPYVLASQSKAWADEMKLRYGQWQGPSYAVGTDFVPRTGLAMIHQGERIIPATQNASLLNNQSAMVDELRALRAEVVLLRAETRATATHTSKMSSTFDRLMPDGDALSVRAAA